MASFICLPNVASRDMLQSLQLAPEKLDYILTGEELKNLGLQRLGLQDQSVGAPAEEYEAMASIFTGSASVFGTGEKRFAEMKRIRQGVGSGQSRH